MREILFRGKRVDNGEWAEGGFFYGFNNGEPRICPQYEFSQEDKNWLKEHRQQAVNSIPLGKDKWHCYDIPRIFAVGSKEFAHELFNRLKNYEFKGQIEIGVDER